MAAPVMMATTDLLDLPTLRAALSADAQTRAWLEHLDHAGIPSFDIVLPDADDLPPLLLELAVPHEDVDALLTLRPSRERSPALWWLFERCVSALVREMGVVAGRGVLAGAPPFPRLPETLGPIAPYFYVYV